MTNAEELASIISVLGFSLFSDLTKTRQKAKYNGIEICVDDVEDLGVFIEAERMAEEADDGSAIAEELWAEIEKFGVDRSDEVFEGYDVLHNRKKAQK